MRHRVSSRPLTLESVPDDVLILVFEHLDTVDIVALRAVCTRLAAASRLNTVWRSALRHCVCRAIPIPGIGKSFSILAGEMERRVRRAVYLEELWAFRDQFTFRTYQFDAHASGIEQIYLVSGGRCLLTRRGSRVMCWDLGFNSVKQVECIDEWRYVHGLVNTCVVDDQNPTNVLLAVGAWEIDQPTIILQVKPLDSSREVFTELATTPTLGRPIAIRGDILVFYNRLIVRDGDKVGIHLVNWRHGGTNIIPQQDADMGLCVGITFHLDILVIVYHLCIELWTTTSPPEPLQRFFIRFPIHGPLGFTTCLPKTLPRDYIKASPKNVDFIDDQTFSDTRISGTEVKDYPPLTILSSQRPSSTHGISQIMLQQIPEPELPAHFPNAPHLHHILHFHLVRAVTANIPNTVPVIQVGPSGRGVYVSNGTVYAFKPISVTSPFGTIKGTPDLEHPVTVSQSQGVFSAWSIARQVLAFDDAMGRIVVGNEYGAVTVLDCIGM